jgi:fatty acid desaturase
VLGLYLGSTFAPNHKGMTVFDAGQRPDFLRRQVLTSRNLVGGRLTDLAFGGLNFQIEHHLFPSMPSANLRRCGPLVRRFCAEHAVTYTEAGIFDSYRMALRYLASIRPEVRGGQMDSVSQDD